MRRGNCLGMAMVALMALAGVAASAAEAHEFQSEVANTVVTGVNEAGNIHTFTTNTGAAVTCKKATFRGATLGSTSADTFTMVPKYEECTFAGNAATVKVVDCAYVFDSDTVGEHADVDIECAEAGQIEVITSACTIDVRAQTAAGQGVRYFNIPSGNQVTGSATITNLVVAQKTGSPILCAFSGSTGTYSGTATFEGFEYKSNSGTTTTPTYTEGKQVGIELSGASPPPTYVRSEVSPTAVRGTDEETPLFETPAGELTCITGQLAGTMNAKSTQKLRLHPTYSECKFGYGSEGGPAVVRTEGCDYLFRTVGEAEPGQLDIDCEVGNAIEVEVPGLCTLRIGSQESLSGLDFANKGVGSGRDFTVTGTIDDVSYTKVKPNEGGNFCYLFPGEGDDAYYGATSTVKGYVDTGGEPGAQVGMWVE